METAFAAGVHIVNSIDSMDGCTGREIRPLDMLHVFVYRDLRHAEICVSFLDNPLDVEMNCPGNLCEVMRWNSSCHTYGNTVASVEQKIRKAGRENGWFLFGIIEIWLKVNSFLVNIFKHVL